MEEKIYAIEFFEDRADGSDCIFTLPEGITLKQAKQVDKLCQKEFVKKRKEYDDYLDCDIVGIANEVLDTLKIKWEMPQIGYSVSFQYD